MSEAEFLQRQVDDAKTGLTQVANEIGTNLAKGLDIRDWAREHPWATVATAAVAGFVATKVVTSAPQRRQRKRRRRAEKQQTKTAKKKESFGSKLTGHLIDLVKPAALSMLSAMMGTQSQAPTNGHPQEETPSPESPSATPPTSY